MPRKVPFWIKERHNPQLGIYYVPLGKMSKAKAKRYESASYGQNVMIRCEDKADQDKKIAELIAAGQKVQTTTEA